MDIGLLWHAVFAQHGFDNVEAAVAVVEGEVDVAVLEACGAAERKAGEYSSRARKRCRRGKGLAPCPFATALIRFAHPSGSTSCCLSPLRSDSTTLARDIGLQGGRNA